MLEKNAKTAAEKNAKKKKKMRKMQNKGKKKHPPGAERRQKVHFQYTKCNGDVRKHEHKGGGRPLCGAAEGRPSCFLTSPLHFVS